MIKLLDRYIIQKFLSTFFFTVLIFILIAVVIDFSEKVEKFIETPITQDEILYEYYPSFIMFISGLLWPLFTLIAVIFFTSRMAANSEIISIFNSGVSFWRFLRPYMLAASLIAGMHFVGNHLVIPNGNKLMFNIIYTYFDTNEDKGKTRNVHLFIDDNVKVYIRNYRKRDSVAIDFRMEQFSEDKLIRLVKANRAEWLPDEERWRLRNYEVRRFDGMEEEIELGIGQVRDTTLNLRPEDFVDFAEQQSMMTTPELKAYIQQQRSRGASNVRKYEMENARRTAEPFTIYILTLIGVSIAARKVRGGIGFHLALGIGLGAIYIFLSKFSVVFALGSGVPVWLGVWFPNLIFLSVSLWLLFRAQK